MIKTANISPCGLYRYDLWRIWDEALPYCNFVGLNPSTADAELDDPTIRRCIGFAKAWGYGALAMTNLFAFRSTDPMKLYGQKPDAVVGPENDRFLLNIAGNAGVVIAAWGKHGALNGRSAKVLKLLPSTIACLKLNGDGSPGHPLYLKQDLVPKPLNPLRL